MRPNKPNVNASVLRRVGIAIVLLLFAAASASAQKITVMLVSSIVSEPIYRGIEAFTAKTGIEVEVSEFSSWDDLREKLPTMVAGGIAPDVVYQDSGAQADLYHQGVLQPLDRYVARDGFDLSIWPEPLVDAYRFDGKLYSLPTGVSNWAIYYNVNRLAAAGLPPLPTDWESEGFTYDDLVEMAQKATRDTNGDGTPELYGIENFFSNGAQGIHFWGIDWFDKEQTQFLGTSSLHVEALTEIRRLWELRVIGGNWMRGTAVLMPARPLHLNLISEAMDAGGFFDWSVGVLPTVKCRCAPTSFHSLGIAFGAPNPDGAWEFIKFMTTDPVGAVFFSQAENRTPVVPASIDDFERRWESRSPGSNVDVFVTGLNHVFHPNWYRLPRAVFNNLSAATLQIMRGQKDPRAAMEELKPVMEGILREVHAGVR